MLIGETGESLNGYSRELQNSTLFFSSFFLVILYLSQICSFIAHEWSLFKGVGVILFIKDFYCAIT